MPKENKDKYPKTMIDAAKMIGRDTVRGMGLDPDVNYGTVAKKKLSDAAIDAGVVARDVGRLYGSGYGMDVSPTEGERGMQKLREARDEMQRETRGMKQGGMVRTASQRADGCAVRGKTKGKIV
jgi:hypothetical protein